MLGFAQLLDVVVAAELFLSVRVVLGDGSDVRSVWRNGGPEGEGLAQVESFGNEMFHQHYLIIIDCPIPLNIISQQAKKLQNPLVIFIIL